MRRWLLGFAVLVVALAAVGQRHVYRGPTAEPSSWNPRVDRARIVAEGRKLVGLWYDPVQGAFGNVGGKISLIVCMDVPVIAYRNAGTSIRRLLEADYAAHPEHYGPHDGRPGDPFFERRARNLYSYCEHNGCLDQAGPPEPGDVVFLSRGKSAPITHIALVAAVEPDGRYRVVEASRDDWYATREEDGGRIFARGWTFRGFGRPLAARGG
jgi:uncharacterized protein YijF (DUF1287 family)